VAERRSRAATDASPARPAVAGRGVGRRADRALAARLDRLIHEKIRLGIVSALAVNDSLSFTDLKRILHASDGNLSVHARKLETAGYVACTKTFEDRLPRTTYRLTAPGRRALSTYLDHMEALIRSARR
jgi:DNA-binding MarR family transcriptional regulator